MGMEEDFSTIMQTIGWWLKSTSQGMWLTDLQSAKDTMCARWLLFSADEYDREALTQEIWNFISVQVTICFHAIIDDSKKVDWMKKTGPKRSSSDSAGESSPHGHDKVHQGVNWSHIEHLYLSKATVSPLGIKMRFVHDYCLLTNSQAKAKAKCLCSHQEWFLSLMETCTMWEIVNLNLKDHPTEATLLQMIMNILDLTILCLAFFTQSKNVQQKWITFYISIPHNIYRTKIH